MRFWTRALYSDWPIRAETDLWQESRRCFLLPVRAASRLFRRLFLTRLVDAQVVARLASFSELKRLHRREAFIAQLVRLRGNWFVYAKPPFARPKVVLAYLAATPTVLPSRTAGSSPSTRAA